MPLADYQTRIKQEKRAAILAAAEAAFLACGFASTSVNTIAKDAGVSTATLYKHFASKEDLFGTVTGRMWKRLRDQLELQNHQTLPITEALFHILNDYARLLEREDVRKLFRVIIAEAWQFPELGEKLHEHGKEAYLAALERFLAQRVEEGDLKIEDTNLATQQLLGMVADILFWPRLLLPLERNDAERERTVKEAIKTFMARYQA